MNRFAANVAAADSLFLFRFENVLLSRPLLLRRFRMKLLTFWRFDNDSAVVFFLVVFSLRMLFAIQVKILTTFVIFNVAYIPGLSFDVNTDKFNMIEYYT